MTIPSYGEFAPLSLVYSQSSIDDLGRETLSLPVFHVVEDKRNSIEPPATSLWHCTSRCEVSRLSLWPTLHNLHDIDAGGKSPRSPRSLLLARGVLGLAALGLHSLFATRNVCKASTIGVVHSNFRAWTWYVCAALKKQALACPHKYTADVHTHTSARTPVNGNFVLSALR